MTRVHCKVYTDVDGFKRDALPVLQRHVTLDTVCLSELALIKPNSTAAGVYMAVFTCEACNTHHSCIALSAGATDTSHRLLVSDSVCQPLAVYITEHFQQHGCQFTSLTATERVAGLLADSLGFTGRQLNDIMILPAHASATAADGSPPTSAADATAADPTSNNLQQSSSAAAPSLTLKPLDRHTQSDVDLIMQWSADFGQAAMHLDTPPPQAMVRSFVLPWLNEGQYSLALGQDDVPVCMLCHVPTSESSCRIVWVYTPPEHRRHGYARAAVAQLCEQLGRRFEHICLLVAQTNHTAVRVYKDIGFVTAGVLVIANKPGHMFGHAAAKATDQQRTEAQAKDETSPAAEA